MMYLKTVIGTLYPQLGSKKHKRVPGNTLKGHNRMIVVFVFLVVLADFALQRDILSLLLVQLAVEAVGPVLAGLPLLVLLPRVLPLPGAFPLAEVCWVIPVRKLRTVILLLLADFTRGLDTRFRNIFGFAEASQEFCSRLQAT